MATELKNVRSISTGQGIRVRCDINWFLRPGHEATWEGHTFIIRFINYYVTGGGRTAYMDVGSDNG